MNLTGGKDTDKVVLEHLDDRTLLNLMSTNKEYLKLGNNFFRKRIARIHPSFLENKPENQNWANYYLDIVYYIAKLKEEFNFDYNASVDPTHNPKKMYRSFKNNRRLQLDSEHEIYDEELFGYYLVENSVDSNNLRKELLEDFYVLVHAINYSIKIKSKHFIQLIEYLLKNYNINADDDIFLPFLIKAIETNDIGIFYMVFSLLINKLSENPNHLNEEIYSELVNRAAENGNYDLFLSINKLFPNGNYTGIIEPASRGNNLLNFNKFIKHGFSRDPEMSMEELRNAIVYLAGEKKIEFLDSAFNAYKYYKGDKNKLINKIQKANLSKEILELLRNFFR